MEEPMRPAPRPTDPARDGARWSPALGFLAAAAGIVLGALGWWWISPSSAADGVPAAADPMPVTPVASQPAAAPVSTADNGSSPAIRSAPVPAAAPHIRRVRD